MALFGIVWPLYGHLTFVEEKLQVAHLAGGQVVAGSNPVAPTEKEVGVLINLGSCLH